MSTVLSLVDTVKEYPLTPPVRALAGVTLDVDQGELVAVVGPSGSGKSTMLHVMGTLDRPTSGEVSVAGYRVSDLSDAELSGLRAKHIGFVFQAFHLLTGYSALDNVADGLLYTGMGLDERRDLALSALDRVGLSHRLDHVTTQLSGGEGQRVAIARAILGGPTIILADEPTGNLDSKTSAGIVDLLHDLNRDGATIVVVTHDLDIAADMPREIHLNDGLVVSDQTKELI
ncbi:MAG: ABC transporter ATP-binding protein [Actinomycetota bacterium]|nr:ABC transporter ATP-binding protein [Actinomycetota bacterium]